MGEIFDEVYREGSLVNPPLRSVQTALVQPGGSAVVEFDLEVPGFYTLIDRAIFRTGKGASGFLEVGGEPRYDIYRSLDDASLEMVGGETAAEEHEETEDHEHENEGEGHSH